MAKAKFNAFSKSKKKSSKKTTKKNKKTKFKAVKLFGDASALKMYLMEDGKQKTTVQLPVTPSKFEFDREWNNVTQTIVGKGEILLQGKRKLYKCDLEGFFPSDYDSSYVAVPKSKFHNPEWYDQKMASWQNGKILRFITVGKYSHINVPVVIDHYKSGFEKGMDINYSMSLVEYRKKNRAKKATNKTYTTKNGDTLAKIAKKQLKKSKYWKKIYQKNKKAIDRAFKRKLNSYKKKNKKQYRSYLRKSYANRSLPKGIKLKIR